MSVVLKRTSDEMQARVLEVYLGRILAFEPADHLASLTVWLRNLDVHHDD